MAKAKVPDDQLFRRFRRGWVPLWIEETWQRSGPLLPLIGIATLVAVLSWAALTYLPRSTGQQIASVDSWRQRIDESKETDLVPIFQSLFQVRNDRVIDLGVNYMLSSDGKQREAATVALEDSVAVWKDWKPEESSLHIQRVAKSLSRQVAMFNGPEQATAVEVARQFLLWPTADEAEDHSGLLLSCETIFRNAREAFSDRSILDRAANVPELPGVSASDQVAAALLNERPKTFVPRSESKFFSAGYQTRSSVNSSNSGTLVIDAEPPMQSSQVPLVNEEGTALGIRTIDPSTLNLPGGLIPVQLSGEKKKVDSKPDEVTADLPVPPRESLSGILERRNTVAPEITPGNLESNESSVNSEMINPSSAPNRLDDRIASPEMSLARPLRETLQRTEQFERDTPQSPKSEPLDSVPGREPAAWQPPKQPLRRWGHIDVMRLLHSSSSREVDAAERELIRRGFNQQYIAVAYRLTSEDPLDRYNLVFELVHMQRVEPLPFLKFLSTDQHLEVRTAAIEQLNKLTGDNLR